MSPRSGGCFSPGTIGRVTFDLAFGLRVGLVFFLGEDFFVSVLVVIPNLLRL
jgi:hypothetical protein